MVATVRDFSLIFDAYTQYEESMLAAKMEAAEQVPHHVMRYATSILAAVELCDGDSGDDKHKNKSSGLKIHD
jgi:hypothetical protein